MSTLPTIALRPAWLFAKHALVSRVVLALVLGACGVNLFARSAVPIGIAASETRAEALGRELRLLLYGCLAGFVLLRTPGWNLALRKLGSSSAACIVSLSILYLSVIGYAAVAFPEWAILGSRPHLAWLEMGGAIWLASLAGILARTRLAPRSLILVFLVLAWWAPTASGALSAGISGARWSVGEFLPMLVPHLLAAGYACLERAQR